MNSDALRQLHLGQLALAPQLADFPSDQFELCWLIYLVFVDFYAMGK